MYSILELSFQPANTLKQPWLEIRRLLWKYNFCYQKLLIINIFLFHAFCIFRLACRFVIHIWLTVENRFCALVLSILMHFTCVCKDGETHPFLAAYLNSVFHVKQFTPIHKMQLYCWYSTVDYFCMFVLKNLVTFSFSF